MFLSRQRFYASFFILGSGFLLSRTIVMIYQGYLEIFVFWVAALLALELVFDAVCLLGSVNWLISNKKKKSRFPLRMAALVIVLHAIRVFVYVMGRMEPWLNFDVRQEYHAIHHTRWSWETVYFAAIISGISIIVLLSVWIFGKWTMGKNTK